MKKILLLLVALIGVIPVNIWAKDINKKDYVSLNLEEVLKEEEIEKEFSDYEEKEDAITIYLFRGIGCQYCRKFLTFLNSITSEYGEYFKLESYEVWANKNNEMLLKKVANYMGDASGGVPYIIIGDKTFVGFSENDEEKIKEAIKELYESEDRFDVLDALKYEKDSQAKVSLTYIIWSGLLVLFSTALILVFIHNKMAKINKKLDLLIDNLALNDEKTEKN